MALDFNTEPYFDDYDAKKDFYRVLFRPSYAVQARELTQLQTILQNQVSRFGDHVFKNGSQVIPGSVNVDNKVHFIKLEQFTGTVDVSTYIETFKNKIITGETSGVKMRVLDTSGGSAVVDQLNVPTLYCKIEGTADDTITNRLQPGENIIAYTEDNLISTNFRLTEDQLTDITAVIKLTGSASETPTTYTNNASSDVIGYGYSVDVGAGIYYVDGTFVRNDDLKLYVSRFNNTPTCRVGFKVTEETVAPEDDESILDNATGSYNFAAPGAHRYKISLSLVKLPLTGKDTFKFVELVRIVDGRVHQKITNSSYAELEKSLARRTYDESGNYEVNKFKLSVREHLNDGINQGIYTPLADGTLPIEGVTYGDENKFCLVVDPGKAYIQGYEIESSASQFVNFNKAREINGVEGNHIQRTDQQTVGLNLGSYVEIKNLYNIPDILNYEKVYLTKVLQPRVAQATCTVNPSTGALTSVTLVDGGSGYTAGWDESTPGWATHFSVVYRTSNAPTTPAKLNVTVTNGKITNIAIADAGAGYSASVPPEIRLDYNSNIPLGIQPSQSNIVGTARVRGIQLSDIDASIPTNSVYKLGLFDIKMFEGQSFERDVKSVVGLGVTENFACDISPSTYAIPGTASSTSGNTIVTGQGTVFNSTIKVGDIVFLNDVFIGTVATTSGTVNGTELGNFAFQLSGNAPVSIANARITVFSTKLNLPTFESLLFPVGQNNIKTLRGYLNGADSFKNSSIIVRRQFEVRSSTSNSVTWDLTADNENFLSDQDDSNYLLVNVDSGLPVYWTVDDTSKVYVSFDNDENRTEVTFNNVPPGQNYYLIASVLQYSNSAQEAVKSLNKTGSMEIENKKIVNSNTIDLAHADIFKLVSVEMTPDDGTYTFNEDNVVDITDRYTLDNGQRSSYYTYGALNLKPGQPVPNGPIRIKYWYFTYSKSGGNGGNYFSVDSYTIGTNGVKYEEIPSYFTTDAVTGKTKEVSLTDVVDFRPVLTAPSANAWNPELPMLGSDMACPRANYVGRIDKVALDSFGKFNIITGVPAEIPKEPDDPKEGMVLATVTVPPYTKSVKDVTVTQRDNRRYTMRDIGRLERRINKLEYYVTLSLLEKDTAQLSIVDETTGLDRFKNGFIVDQFTGHGVGDVKHEDYRVSVDSKNKILRPMHYTNAVELVEDLTSGADRANKTYQKTGDLITLPYAEQDYIFNANATRTMDVRAISMGAFKGQVQLYPEGDNWKSVNRRPDLTVVDDNNYDAIKFIADYTGVTGTDWNEWQTHWTSITTTTSEYRSGNTQYEATTTNYSGYNDRSGVTTTLTSSVNTQSYGDRVVDMSYIPYMRARPVTFVAQNLKPTTRFYPFFDKIPVKEYVKPADVFKVTRVSNSLMSFELADLQNNVLTDDPRRAFDGTVYRTVVGETGSRVEPAFGFGDVIANTTHTAINIVSIANLTSPATTFTMVVSDTSNLFVGNHVVLYNLNYHNSTPVTRWQDYSGTVIPVSNKLINPAASSKQLNLKTFKIVGINGGTLTLGNIDGSSIEAFDAYSTASYDDNQRGRLYRLKASGVVAYGGTIHSSDTIGPIQQDIHIVNIKNGFGVGETLTGTVTIGSTGNYNGFVVNEINGATTGFTMKSIGDHNTTDVDGSVVGVFFIPETDALAFRTGERTFKLTDNLSDSSAQFDSSGSAVYYAQGIALDKERTVVSTRAAQFIQSAAYENTRDQGLPPVRRSTTSTRVLYQYSTDPLAQTFVVNNPGGAFVTSIDLYFSEAGRRPVALELRPTDNGVPSSTKVIPFSQVVRTPSEIVVSEDSSKPTQFKFRSPIYLQDNETYAFVVMTDEPGAQMWVSEMGQKDILTGNTIAGQPLTGSLYASQNAQEWEIHTLLDIKFVLRTAKFNTNVQSELFLKNSPPDNIGLDSNPFTITNGVTKVRIKARNHGLMAGQTVTISGVPQGFHGSIDLTKGIPDTMLNATHTVLSEGLDKDSFIIQLTTTEAGSGNNLLSGTTADFTTGQYGGNSVSITRGLFMDDLYLKTSDLVFTDTKIDYYAKTMNTNSVIGSYLPVVANSDNNFTTRMMIPALENYNTVNNVKVAPLQIKAVMSSSNPNVSPVIDLQQLSGFAVSNLINNTSASELNVADIDTRVLLTANDIVTADTEEQGTGNLTTASTSSTSITGTDTLFRSQVFPGNKLYRKSDNQLIGTVSTVSGTVDTSLTLTANSLIDISGATEFIIQANPTLSFANNADGLGKISTNIDTADNLLSSASVGKVMIITGVDGDAVSPKLIDGTYTITDVQVIEDRTVYAGNSEGDICIITLDRGFGTTATIDMITDGNFNISILDKYVDDTAPYGASNNANYITRTLSLAEPAEVIKVIFDANIPNSTEIKVYYRTWTGNDVDLRKLRWNDTGYVSDAKDVSSDFVEREITKSGVPSFNNVQIKIVMKSTRPVAVPKIKNLRVLALT
jgi:hypothetical protein